MQTDLSELDHLENDQGIVEEQIASSDYGQIGEEVTEALQTVDAKHEQVIGDHSELRETEAAKVLSFGPEH